MLKEIYEQPDVIKDTMLMKISFKYRIWRFAGREFYHWSGASMAEGTPCA
jgi:glucosamine 6-phosphate synthetase-like amidotransferase/phosphosugar isomerase protein